MFHVSQSTTAANLIHSEASLGKVYLKEMGIKPWCQIHLDFPPDPLDHIMSTYYGSRVEVHIYREAVLSSRILPLSGGMRFNTLSNFPEPVH